jgi:hypothetical protein
MPHATGWGDLPDELIDIILNNLSWFELARLSLLSQAFRAAFYRQLTPLQTKRLGEAAYCFGPDRLHAIVNFIGCYFKGEVLHPEWSEGRQPACFVMSRDGVMTLANSIREVCQTLGGPSTLVIPDEHRSARAGAAVVIMRRNVSRTVISVEVPFRLRVDLRLCRRRRKVGVYVYPHSDYDIEGSWVPQGLLDVGLASTLHDAGVSGRIIIMGRVYRGVYCPSGGMTKEGLLCHVGPLLPFVRKTRVHGRWGGSYKSQYSLER